MRNCDYSFTIANPKFEKNEKAPQELEVHVEFDILSFGDSGSWYDPPSPPEIEINRIWIEDKLIPVWKTPIWWPFYRRFQLKFFRRKIPKRRENIEWMRLEDLARDSIFEYVNFADYADSAWEY